MQTNVFLHVILPLGLLICLTGLAAGVVDDRVQVVKNRLRSRSSSSRETQLLNERARGLDEPASHEDDGESLPADTGFDVVPELDSDAASGATAETPTTTGEALETTGARVTDPAPPDTTGERATEPATP